MLSCHDRGVEMLRRDIDYYRQRAAAERRLALSAYQHNVAEIHEELARQYQALIDYAELRPQGSLEVLDALPA